MLSGSSFSGEVTLGHSRTSIRDLVERLEVPDASPSTRSETPIVIPSLQREFCWDTDDIEALFDSLLRGLPIGSLLLWNVPGAEPEAGSEAQYRFIRNYVEHSNFPTDQVDEPVHHHSVRLEQVLEPPFTSALDGQQRLTSFLIGLRGSFYEHRKWKHTDSVSSYYRKELCLDLLTDPNRVPDDAQEHLFAFDFRRESQQGHDGEEAYWWPVSNIWDANGVPDVPGPLNKVVDESDSSLAVAADNLERLHEAITVNQIACEEVQGMRSEEALELFIRRNKGGQQLSNSDIAFSLITVYWDRFNEGEDPKEVFESKGAELSDEFGDYSFGFGKGFLIRTLLYLDDEKPSFERDILVPDTIKPLEDIWGERFFKAIRAAFSIVTEEYGLTGKCLGGKTTVLPIIYHCWARLENIKAEHVEEVVDEFSSEELDRMEYWLQMTVFNNLFNVSSSMTVLDNVRGIIKDSETFHAKAIEKEYRGGPITVGVRSAESTEEAGVSVSELVRETDHGSETTIRNYLLTKLYDDRGVGELFETKDGETTSIEVDHFYPAVKLRDKENRLTKREIDPNVIEFCGNHVNDFGNFTLLPQGAAGNQSKSEKDPQDWLDDFDDDESREEQKTLHILPEMEPYTYEKYEAFLKHRESDMIDALRTHLVVI